MKRGDDDMRGFEVNLDIVLCQFSKELFFREYHALYFEMMVWNLLCIIATVMESVHKVLFIPFPANIKKGGIIWRKRHHIVELCGREQPILDQSVLLLCFVNVGTDSSLYEDCPMA